MLAGPGQTHRIMSDDNTHFGFQSVPLQEKARRVRGVFDSVASRYDVMNDLMSGGLHRLWKRQTIREAAVRRGQAVLDLAGGTGDLAMAFARQVGESGQVVLADINASMLQEGRRPVSPATCRSPRWMPNSCRSPTARSTASRSRSDCVT